MNYFIGSILILLGLAIIVNFPQKEKIVYITKQEVKFDRDGEKLIMNMPKDKYIERVEILYSDEKLDIDTKPIVVEGE